MTPVMRFPRSTLSAAVLAALGLFADRAHAQAAPAPADAASAPQVQQLETVTVKASADASRGGLKAPYAGGQVARGGRVGILGSQDVMDTPFSVTNYTQKLIQDQQAASIGDVLLNDPAVRVARGFGNYQQAYFVRGLPVFSDDMAYNGLYGLLPRQYLATEFLERVEVLRGASAFLNGAAPGGSGLGGAINAVPKRAPNEALNEITLGIDSGGQGYAAADIARRFGPDQSVGVRLNLAQRDGKTVVDNERKKLTVAALGLDFRTGNLRLSADIGFQDNKLTDSQPSITIASGPIPSAPDASKNYGQPWNYSNERDTFGTIRAEYDITRDWTVWGAYGMRNGDEANDLSNPTLTAAGLTYLRSVVTRSDRITTGEIGVRGQLKTGDIGHTLVFSAATYRGKTDAPSQFADFAGVTAGDLSNPVQIAPPALLFNFQSPSDTRTTSFAVSDTLSLLQDTLKVTLGARSQTFKDPLAVPEYKESRVTPVAGVVYKVSKAVSLYGSYVEGLVKGDIAPATFGFPAQPVANAGQIFKPYQTKQGEVGVKVDLGRLGGSLSVYDARKPTYSVDPTTLVFAQTDKVTNRGVEVTVYGEAMPGLRLLGGGGYTNAKVESTGLRSIGVPKFQANLSAEWDVPAVQGLALTSRVMYTGSQYADSANTQQVPSWTTLGIGARYAMAIGGKDVTLRLLIDNLTNRNYWASAGGYPGAGYLVLGDPRTFKLSGTVAF